MTKIGQNMTEFKKIQPNWNIKGLKVFTTTNEGKISTGAYAGFNTATHTGADTKEVQKAREILSDYAKRPINWLNQVHKIEVSQKFEPEADRDAAILRTKNYAIAIQTADCLPLVLANKDAQEVAILHCGWRGLAGGIIKNTLDKMQTKKTDLKVWFGPCIDAQNYEVGAEIWKTLVALKNDYYKCFSPSFYRLNHYQLDIKKLAQMQLLENGIEDFYFSKISSFDDWRFYSHRENPVNGRNATIAYLL